jgi:phage tail tape measure protein, TP901 family|nr:MAG TPA: minor tail protein [Caudoviricetes sp.]
MGSVELATGYFQLVPSMQGAERKITDEITEAVTGASDKAGSEGGKKLSERLAEGLQGWAMPALAGGLLAGLGKGLYEVGSVFDDVNDTIRVGTGASGEALEGMVEVAKRIGRSVPVEYSKIGSTVADLNTRLGLSGDTLEKVASQYLEAGRLLGQDVNIQKTTAAFSAFGIQGEQVIDAMDNLFRVSQATGVGMNELASAAQQAAPSMKTLGFSFEDTIAMVGAFDKAGLNSTAVMAALSKGLVTLAKKGEDPKQAFSRVTSEIQGFLDKGNEAAALELASKIFGTRGAMQFVEAMKSGTLSAGDMMQSIGSTDDSILGLAEETMDFAEQWTLLKNRALEALEPLGSQVFTWLGDTTAELIPKFQALADWVSQNTWVFNVLGALLTGVVLVGLYSVTAAIWSATAAMLANPITWIVAAIGLLAAGLYLLITNWEQVVAWLNGVWAECVAWLTNCWSGVGDAWNAFAAWVGEFWAGIVNGFNAFIEYMGSMKWAEDFSNAAIAGFGLLGEFIGNLPGMILDGLAFLGDLWLKAVEWFGAFVKSGIDAFLGYVRWLSELPGKIISAISSLGPQLWQFAVDSTGRFLEGAKGVWDSIVSFVSGVPDGIMRALGDMGNFLLRSGEALVGGFLRGIQNSWNKLTSWVSDGMSKLRGLWPFSPAKWGPFSGRGYVTYSGEAIVTDFADSIAGQQGYLESKARGVAQVARDIIPDSSGATINNSYSNSGSINVNTYNVDPYSTAVAVSQALRRLA